MDHREQSQDNHGVTQTSAGTAEICRKHGLSSNTFYPWREKFLEEGKMALARGQDAGTVKSLQKESATLKTLVGKITLTNDALKKTLERRKKGWSHGN